ncbi:transmembrane and coiled-coil domain-containing protein 1-like [Populus alba x Populus x berolinensis]|uniref:Transmembrane and coiled-coil domain-containing protein 1-like n=1 Tax=Populus alba x Populus x berolinensis TaxID=444605 RepID=A0AAD6LM05_9ROSI|nr:transmembrane and coiled-coil domain-containing protein 1-like [Populus alba x Populus x berolinensis]KAJ6968207.1 transmembrane and coiled-coil domain-containing protein 1-like [Populus alba x Populus x berolinensis]
MATPQFFLSSSKYSDSLTVVGISICTAIICETISWILIYRTNSYKSLKSSIDKASKKLETMKTDTAKITTKKSKTKKIDRVESSLKESSRDLSLFKFKSGAVVALVLIVVFGLLNSLFEGKAVAKLPFHPITLVMKMSHRGLPGTDSTDCSMAFLSFLGFLRLVVLLLVLVFSPFLIPRPIDSSIFGFRAVQELHLYKFSCKFAMELTSWCGSLVSSEGRTEAFRNGLNRQCTK